MQTSPRSSIGVLILLPRNWNGRFVGVGSGGAGGVLRDAALAPYAAQGYAAAMTDLGTSPDPASAGWRNPEAVSDFGHRATHAMTQAVRERVAAKYGRAPLFSYFVGASTGGQQAFAEAQRHPGDYDGILAGVPAHSRTRLHAYFLWNWRHSRNPDGSPLFTRAQEKGIRAAAIASFAPRERFPGAAGRFVSAPRWPDGAIDAAIDAEARNDHTLGPASLRALRALYSGPRHAATGERLFDGIPPGGDFSLARSNLYLFHWVFGPGADLASLDFGGDYDRYRAALAPDLDADNPDLDAFRAAGGRLLAYAGTQDSCVPCGPTLDYFDAVAARLGSRDAARSFFRLYVLPGREHFGGPGIQELRRPLDALRRWREKGVAPSLEGVSCTEHRIVALEPY